MKGKIRGLVAVVAMCVAVGCGDSGDGDDVMTTMSTLTDTDAGTSTMESGDPATSSADPTGDPTTDPATTDPSDTGDICQPNDDCQTDVDCEGGGMCVACICVGGVGGDCSAPDCAGCTDCMLCQNCVTGAGGACATVFATCSANPECVGLNNCNAACPAGDQACIMDCVNMFPNGVNDLLALLECIFGPMGMNGPCSDACA